MSTLETSLHTPKPYRIVAAPLGFYAVVEDYWQSRRDSVEEARADLARAIDLLTKSTTELVWLAV